MDIAERTIRMGPWLLGGFAVAGLALAIWQPVGLDRMLAWGQWLTAHPAALTWLIVLMVVMFTFGLPASVFVWLLAPFHPPLLAVAMLLTGSVGGALSAYALARRLGEQWQPGARTERAMALLARHGDLITQCALRIAPGIPHAVVNYAAGLLRLPLSVFLAAAILGLGIKWSVYVTAIHHSVAALERGEMVGGWTLLPLAGVAVLLLLASWARHWLAARASSPQQ